MAADCSPHVSAGIDGTIGTYGGEASATCPTGVGSGAGGSSGDAQSTYVLIFTRPEPSRCAGTPDALLEVREVYDSSTNQRIGVTSDCIGPNIPRDRLPPPPPSATEVVQRLPLPPPLVQTSPPGQGLVGFETWLWWGGDANPPPVTIVVDGWSATVAPVLLSVDWDMGNGDVVAGNGPGSEENPSAKYVYENQCDCTITVTLTWGGTVTLSHVDAPAPLVMPAPPVPFATSAPYDVIEREAVIVG